MIQMQRRLLLVGAFGLLAVRAHAQPVASDVSAPIIALNQGLISAMRSGSRVPFRGRYDTLAPIVLRAFNLPLILQNSIGPRWSSFQPAEQQQLYKVFERFTIATYVASFSEYGGERIDLLPGMRSVGNDQVIGTQITPAQGDPTRIDYVMRRGQPGWQAVDVLLQGSISRVAVQRSDFRAMLASGGPETLISSLQRKVSDLSGGML